MNWLRDLVGEISKFEASQEERVALVSVADRLWFGATGLDVQIPKPSVIRHQTMPALIFDCERGDRMLIFLIEDPTVGDCACTCIQRNSYQSSGLVFQHEFRKINLRERLRTFFTYDK